MQFLANRKALFELKRDAFAKVSPLEIKLTYSCMEFNFSTLLDEINFSSVSILIVGICKVRRWRCSEPKLVRTIKFVDSISSILRNT